MYVLRVSPASENIRVVRDAHVAVEQRNIEAFMALLVPDVEWDDTEGAPGSQEVYRGATEARRWYENAFLDGAWDSFRFEIEEITEVGEGRVFCEVVMVARGASSGIE